MRQKFKNPRPLFIQKILILHNILDFCIFKKATVFQRDRAPLQIPSRWEERIINLELINATHTTYIQSMPSALRPTFCCLCFGYSACLPWIAANMAELAYQQGSAEEHSVIVSKNSMRADGALSIAHCRWQWGNMLQNGCCDYILGNLINAMHIARDREGMLLVVLLLRLHSWKSARCLAIEFYLCLD